MDLLNLIISLVAGLIGGGISASIIISKQITKQKSKGDNSPNILGDATDNHFGDNYTILQNEEDQDLTIINEIFDYVLKKIQDSEPSKIDEHLNIKDKIKLNFNKTQDQDSVSQYFNLALPKINLIQKRLAEEPSEIQNDIQAHIFEMYYKLKSTGTLKNINILHELFAKFIPKNKKNDPSYSQVARSFVLFFFEDCSIFEKTSEI